VLSDGTAKCWGRNDVGQLGDGTVNQRNTPVSVVGITTAKSIDVGQHHSYVVLTDGSVKCWGSNDWSVLGVSADVLSTFSSTPLSVSGITQAKSVALGWRNSCALLTLGHAECWGYSYIGNYGEPAQTPENAGTFTPGTSISSGTEHLCAILSQPPSVVCFGKNDVGQLGDGTDISINGFNGASNRDFIEGVAPNLTHNTAYDVTVPSTTSVTSISAGYKHTCAVLSEGSVIC
jgi:alpha-tubulin suppressor-like RCC1 family protein